MANLDYKNLYITQDNILKIVFNTTQEFYLTGGTCLNRFYYEKRYSDDLDFFTNSSNLFRQAIGALTDSFEDANLDFKKQVDSKDFVRFAITEHSQQLQLDFVNDRVKRIGLAKNLDGFLIDTIDNILSNKITAIVGRDEPKDVFDIFMIAKFNDVDWGQILKFANEKSCFAKEDLLFRLDSFPKYLLSKIKLIDDDFISDFDSVFASIIKSIKEAESS
jgi:predicted nucleotidyltransferase component of viral defense system